MLTACQYGFRNKYNTVDDILEISEQIVENLEDNCGSACTLIDHTEAFDTVDHKILMEKYKLYGLRGKAVSLLRSYLDNGKQYVI